MMKTCKIRGILLIAICSLLVLVPMNVNAKTKNSVAYSVEKGVLIITGKGAIPKNISVKDKNKIKKIVVKKGITSIPIGAFSEFKNVKELSISSSVQKIGEGAFPNSKRIKKITMPGNFKIKTEIGDDASYDLVWNYKTKIDTIIFNSSLSLKTLAYIRSNHLIVDKKDTKYTSVGGVIYSKDKKSIVRVPARRKEITLIDGCEEFCLESVRYGTHDAEIDCWAQCSELEKIVLPTSIKKITYKKYYAFASDIIGVKELVVRSESIDDEQIFMLMNGLHIKDEKAFLTQFSTIKYDNGMYIYIPTSSLIRYDGTEDVVNIPDSIKKICSGVFYSTEVKKVVMPESVTEIGSDVFTWCSKLEEVVFPTKIDKLGKDLFYACGELHKVKLPTNLTEIPEGMFRFCSSLTDISLPDTIITIGESSFEGTNVPASILQQGNIQTIRYNAFSLANWKEIVLPESIRKIEDYAFPTRKLQKIVITGSSEHYDPFAFHTYWSDAKETVLYFSDDVSNWKTGASANGYFRSKTKGSSMDLKWIKVAGATGYQIQVSSNKNFSKKKASFWVKKNKTKKSISCRKIYVQYVRIRPYKQVGTKKEFGRWSVITLPD